MYINENVISTLQLLIFGSNLGVSIIENIDKLKCGGCILWNIMQQLGVLN